MNLSSEELISKRKELIKPVFDEFHEWLLEIKPKVPPTLMFGRAINYAYLRCIFDQAPFCESEKDFEKLLPWNIKITEFNEEGTWKTDA